MSHESALTEVSSPVAFFLAAVGAAVLLAVPASRHLSPPGAEPFAGFAAGVAQVFDEDGGFFPTNRRLQRQMDDVERRLEEGSRALALTRPPVQWLLTGWGGVGNETVYVGRRGWLYLRQGFDHLAGPPFLDPRVLERRRRGGEGWREAPRADPRPAVLDFHRRLEARGIRLVVLPVPTKAAIHPEALAAGWTPPPDGRPLRNPSFTAFRDELEAAGVTVFDPTGTLERYRRRSGEHAFLWTDSHWSPGAVDAVAEELAARLRLLEPGFAEESITWQRRAETRRGEGDLARALELPSWGRHYPDQEVSVRRVTGEDGRPWRPDPGADVLVLGDSFTNVFSEPGPDVDWGRGAGLAEQLAYHLGRGVDRLAVNADGAKGSRLRLEEEMRGGRDRLAGKEVVVWEFAARELTVGDWRLVER